MILIRNFFITENPLLPKLKKFEKSKIQENMVFNFVIRLNK